LTPTGFRESDRRGPETDTTTYTPCEHCDVDCERDELQLISEECPDLCAPEDLVCDSCLADWLKEYREGFRKWQAEVDAEYAAEAEARSATPPEEA
jgi:hypothetical protein